MLNLDQFGGPVSAIADLATTAADSRRSANEASYYQDDEGQAELGHLTKAHDAEDTLRGLGR